MRAASTRRPSGAGGCAERLGAGGSAPGPRGNLPGLRFEVLAALREETGPVEVNDGVQAAL